MNRNLIDVIDRTEALRLAYDAKIVAFRWDILPWALVIDIDYKKTQKMEAMILDALG